jgi:hypothetical protein
MSRLDRVKRRFFFGWFDSHEGLWSLLSALRCECPEMGPAERRRASMEIIKELLDKGLVKAGLPMATGGFAEWNGPSEEILRRIENEWDKRTGESDAGLIVWFLPTEKGVKEARRIEAEEVEG